MLVYKYTYHLFFQFPLPPPPPPSPPSWFISIYLIPCCSFSISSIFLFTANVNHFYKYQKFHLENTTKQERKIARKQQYLCLNLWKGYNIYKIYMYSLIIFFAYLYLTGYLLLNAWSEDFFVCGILADHHWRATMYFCVYVSVFWTYEDHFI